MDRNLKNRKPRRAEPPLAVFESDLENAIRDNLSPKAVSAVIVGLKLANVAIHSDDDAVNNELTWFGEFLHSLLGEQEHRSNLEELGL